MGLFEPANEGRSPFDPGTYVATLLRLEPTEHPEYGPGIKWVCALAPDLSEPDDYVVQNDGETISELWAQTSRAMGPQANARKYAEAFLNRKLQAEEQLEPEDLLDKKATVLVGENKGKDGKIYAKITSISPYKGKPAPVRTRTRAVPKEEEELEDLPF